MDRSAHRAPGGRSTRDSEHLSVKVAEGVPSDASKSGCADAMPDCGAKPRTTSQITAPIHAGQGTQSYIPPRLPAYRLGDRPRGHQHGVPEGPDDSRLADGAVDSAVKRWASRPMSSHIDLCTDCCSSCSVHQPGNCAVDWWCRICMSTYGCTGQGCPAGKFAYSRRGLMGRFYRGISGRVAGHCSVTEPDNKCGSSSDDRAGNTLECPSITVSTSVLGGVVPNRLSSSTAHHRPQLCGRSATSLSRCYPVPQARHCPGCSQNGCHANLARHQTRNLPSVKPDRARTYDSTYDPASCRNNKAPCCRRDLRVRIRSDA